MIAKLLTRLLFFALFTCFFFPFIPHACSSGSTVDNSVGDSSTIAAPFPAVSDSGAIDSKLTHEVNLAGDRISTRDTTISNKDSTTPTAPEKNKIAQFILSPDEENLSGIGFLILYRNWIFFNSGFLVAILSIIIGLVLSFRSGKYSIWIFRISMINLIAWTMMLLSMFKEVKLGIWMGTGISLLLFIFQFYAYRQHKKRSA